MVTKQKNYHRLLAQDDYECHGRVSSDLEAQIVFTMLSEISLSKSYVEEE